MLDLSPRAEQELWHVKDGSIVKEIDADRLRNWVELRHLSGLEAARPKGKSGDPFRSLYSYPVYEPFIGGGRTARKEAYRREWLRMRTMTIAVAVSVATLVVVYALMSVPTWFIWGAVGVCTVMYPMVLQTSLQNFWRHRDLKKLEELQETFD